MEIGGGNVSCVLIAGWKKKTFVLYLASKKKIVCFWPGEGKIVSIVLGENNPGLLS